MTDPVVSGRAELALELNNQLAAIQGNADLMRGDFGGVEAIRESLDEIDKAVARAHDVARRLLAEAAAVEPRAASESAPRSRPQLHESRGQTVLIADDEEPVRRVASRLLARNGYDVVEASNGAEALRKLAAGGIDLLVSDIIMPEMGGLELARRVAAEFPTLPILLISGYSENPDLGHAIPIHLDLLQKPFSGNELTAAVARSLARGKPSS